MPELTTTLTQKGQVTIPQSVRKSLGLKPRDEIVFTVEGEQAILRCAPSMILAGYGAVNPTQHPENFVALRDAFEQGVADEVREETL